MATDWATQFIVYRIREDGRLIEVFQSSDFKKVKYWMTYIAVAGDVCCRTPIHPKHSGASSIPEYYSHKESSGSATSDPGAWEMIAKDKQCDFVFPDRQQVSAESEV